MADRARTFTFTPAVRERVPLLISISGPSGAGKTLSMLRLATGITRVTGGRIAAIDTEGRRMLHYAPKKGEAAQPLHEDVTKRTYDFVHAPFEAPFSPAAYEQAIRDAAALGPGVLLVDSGTHEHDGIGGVIDLHDKYMASHGNDKRHTWSAWIEPKRQRRHLIDAYTSLGLNIIFGFRAKEKLLLEKDENPKSLGWMPVAGEEHLFEMTLSMILYPGAKGVPVWQTTMPGEKLMLKRYDSLVPLFRDGEAIDERLGEDLARWAAGDAVGAPSDEDHAEALDKIAGAGSEAELRSIAQKLKQSQWSPKQHGAIATALNARNAELRGKDEPPPTGEQQRRR